VEPLEDRQLLSVTASLSDGLLSVIGDAAGDSMVVRQADNQITVVGTEYSFAADAVSSVSVQGLAGNHVIDVRGVSKPSTLSGPGNDRFLIDLTSPVTLPAYNATDQITFSDSVQMYRVRIDGSVWAMRRDGSLYGSGQLIDSTVLSFDLTPNGIVYELNARQGGVLLQSATGDPGSFQQIAPGNTSAFSMTADGTAYALGSDHVLRRNQGGAGGNCDLVMDASPVQAIVSAGPNTVFDLRVDHTLILLNADGSSYLLDASPVQAIVSAGPSSVFDLRVANSLILLNADGSSYLLDASPVQAIVSAGPSSVFDLRVANSLILLNADGSSRLLDASPVQAIVSAGPSSVFDLRVANSLILLNADGSSRLLDASPVQAIVSAGFSSVFDLRIDHSLILLNADGSSRLLDASPVQAIVSAGPSSVFDLRVANSLILLNADGSSRLLDASPVQAIVSAGFSSIFDLRVANSLILLNADGSSRLLDASPVQAIVSAGFSSVFDLRIDHSLILLNADGSSRLLDRLVYSINVGPDGSLILDDWFSRNLSDPGIQTLTRMDFTRDDSVSRNDMLGLFAQAEADGVVTGAELHDLQVLVANAGLLQMPAYVQYLASRVANGDPANAHYQGQALGNLFAGSPAWRLQDLVAKWFLGMDHPTAGAAYNPVSGVLFSGSPSYQDVFQGALGDCTVMASVAEVAARTNLINSMFIDNGDGTWTVRFYRNGAPVYVTVDNQLPGGGNLYDHPHNGVLWVALAEKAYAQLNESGWLGTLLPGFNSYFALDYGNGDTIVTALSALTGRPATFGGPFVWLVIGTVMSQGQLVVLATGDSTGNPHIEHNHAYAVVHYTAGAPLPFMLFSPWGIYGGYDNGNFIWGQFTANLAALEAYFDGGAWTGEAARTSLPEGVIPVNAFEVGSTPRQPAVDQSHDGWSNHAQWRFAPSTDVTTVARPAVGTVGADTCSFGPGKQAPRRCESDMALSRGDQLIEDVILALTAQEEGVA
jgi:hypothetical protein